MAAPAVPAFTLNVGNQILKGLATVGKFDGRSPSLACATSGGKVLLHSPHEGSGNGFASIVPTIRFLNLNRKITALSSGSLMSDKAIAPDMLFVGTQSNLLAYDVERNSDVYFRDVQDGVNALTVGRLSNILHPVVIAGGNCSILGYDKDGMEMFWTVTGDNVSSLALTDIDNDGSNELVVGSDDFEIRFYKNENLMSEVTEADKVTMLSGLGPKKFAYGLSNGTVGVYENSSKRTWRAKTKNKVTCMAPYDIDLDGVLEVVTGWNNCVLQARNSTTGDLVFKDTLNAPLASILTADYRMDGKVEVIACSEAGEIKGYLPNTEPPPANEPTVDQSKDLKAIERLQAKKQDLINEMRQLEKSLKNLKSNDPIPGSLPANTNLSCSLIPDQEAGYVTMLVTANTDVAINNLVAIDLESAVLSGLEVVAVSPASSAKSVILPLHPVRNIPCTIRIQAHLSVRGHPNHLHVMEADVLLPRFSAFLQLMETSGLPAPSSLVTFTLPTTVERFHDWMQSAFVLNGPIKYTKDRLKAAFLAVCGASRKDGAAATGGIHAGEHVTFAVSGNDGSGSRQGTRLTVQIRCESMDLAGDLIQDIAKFTGLTELESTASFPSEATQFGQVRYTASMEDHFLTGVIILEKVEDFNSARVRLTADMAEESQRVKALVVRAEDSRLMGDMEAMRRAYTELFALNNNLIGGYNLRASNHEGLLSALKEVNQMIQKAANLRVGTPKTRVIAECRAAVKKNNLSALLHIISNGSGENFSQQGSRGK